MEGAIKKEPGKRYISLVSTENEITRSGRTLETKKVSVGDFGLVHLVGDMQGNSYPDEDTGIALIDGELVSKPAEELNQMKLFDMLMELDLVGKPEVNPKIKCEILTPDNKIFYASFEDFDDSYLSPEERTSSKMISDWKSEDGQRVAFFTDGKPESLSKLRFNFTVE